MAVKNTELCRARLRHAFETGATQDWQKLHPLSERLASIGIMRSQLRTRPPLKLLNTIEYCDGSRCFKGAPWRPRNASLSDSYFFQEWRKPLSLLNASKQNARNSYNAQAYRETAASRHHGGTFKGHPETPQTITDDIWYTEGFKGDLN